jgi:hypothetical protein
MYRKQPQVPCETHEMQPKLRAHAIKPTRKFTTGQYRVATLIVRTAITEKYQYPTMQRTLWSHGQGTPNKKHDKRYARLDSCNSHHNSVARRRPLQPSRCFTHNSTLFHVRTLPYPAIPLHGPNTNNFATLTKGTRPHAKAVNAVTVLKLADCIFIATSHGMLPEVIVTRYWPLLQKIPVNNHLRLASLGT